MSVRIKCPGQMSFLLVFLVVSVGRLAQVHRESVLFETQKELQWRHRPVNTKRIINGRGGKGSLGSMDNNAQRLRGGRIDCQASMMAKDPATNLLYQAIRNGDSEMIKCLIERGVNLEDPMGQYGSPSLTLAVVHEQASVVRLLLDAGVDVEAVSRGDDVVHASSDAGTTYIQGGTALSMAAARGNLEIVQLLLDEGADPNHMDQHKGTPLHEAAFTCGPITVLEALVTAGADVNARTVDHGVSPLHLASMTCPRGVEVLLAHGAHVNTRLHHRTSDGFSPDTLETPLDLALRFHQKHIAIMLSRNGGRVSGTLDPDEVQAIAKSMGIHVKEIKR